MGVLVGILFESYKQNFQNANTAFIKRQKSRINSA